MASPFSEQSGALAASHVGMCRRQERDFPKKRTFTLGNWAKREWSRMEEYRKGVDGIGGVFTPPLFSFSSSSSSLCPAPPLLSVGWQLPLAPHLQRIRASSVMKPSLAPSEPLRLACSSAGAALEPSSSARTPLRNSCVGFPLLLPWQRMSFVNRKALSVWHALPFSRFLSFFPPPSFSLSLPMLPLSSECYITSLQKSFAKVSR